jgi:hypothetical protein
LSSQFFRKFLQKEGKFKNFCQKINFRRFGTKIACILLLSGRQFYLTARYRQHTTIYSDEFGEKGRIPMSRNYLSALVFAVTFLFVANVRADVVTTWYTYDLATSMDGWEVATLFTSNDKGYSNPAKNGSKYTSTGTTWGSIAKNYAWNNQTWSAAAVGERDTWLNGGTGWVAGVNAGNDWVWNGVNHNSNNNIANGFYAFKYTMTAQDPEASSVAGTLSLTLAADDYIAAIYANGSMLYSANPAIGAVVGDDTNGLGGWLGTWNGNYDVALADGLLDLVFVVHNTNGAGSANANPMGLFVDGTLTTSIAMIPPTPPAATPEPATLALFGLGLAGLGLARARRRK